MNTLNYKKSGRKLEITLTGDFNLNAVKRISDLLDDRKELVIDLQQSRFVNSRAIIFLHRLMNSEPPVKVQISNPPKIFFELLQVLDLHKNWKLDEIVQP
ncbi:MAG: hypothetical protein R3283_08960 [Balneolaceae bacterium]|nr:hypothetical protein [Balneolaceae bacterium]